MIIPLSPLSKERLRTCHKDLIRVIELAATRTPLAVTCGWRSQKDQDAAFKEGRSKLKFPKSRHNTFPSEAVDCCPLPVDFLNLEAFKSLAAVIKQAALELGVEIEHGGDWKKFPDYPHYQLKFSPTKPSDAA